MSNLLCEEFLDTIQEEIIIDVSLTTEDQVIDLSSFIDEDKAKAKEKLEIEAIRKIREERSLQELKREVKTEPVVEPKQIKHTKGTYGSVTFSNGMAIKTINSTEFGICPSAIRETDVYNRLISLYVPKCYDISIDEQGNTTLKLEKGHTTLHEASYSYPYEVRCKAFKKVFTEALISLGSLHSKNIIHRDLKPDNIILTDSGVKMIDFSLSRENLNEVGILSCTKMYRAPEVDINKDPVSFASDIYSLTCCVIFFLSKQQGNSPDEWLHIAQQLFTDNCWISLITLCLHTNPDRRPSSIEILKVLDKNLDEVSIGINDIKLPNTFNLDMEFKREIINNVFTISDKFDESNNVLIRALQLFYSYISVSSITSENLNLYLGAAYYISHKYYKDENIIIKEVASALSVSEEVFRAIEIKLYATCLYQFIHRDYPIECNHMSKNFLKEYLYLSYV